MELKNIIAQNITELRKQKKLTQAEFAERLNYTDKAISKWERGESIPSIDVLKQIADMFGVKVDYLLQEGSFIDKQDLVLPKENNQNKISITALAVTVVWFIATVVYVYTHINLNLNLWVVFVWAVPVSCIVLGIFNFKWGKHKFYVYINSLFIWSLLTSLYLSFLTYQVWLIFIIGVPVQISIILWQGLTPRKKNKIQTEKNNEQATIAQTTNTQNPQPQN
mgnify:CR=1 FL=1